MVYNMRQMKIEHCLKVEGWASVSVCLRVRARSAQCMDCIKLKFNPVLRINIIFCVLYVLRVYVAKRLKYVRHFFYYV